MRTGWRCLVPAAVLRRTDTAGGPAHAHALENTQEDCGGFTSGVLARQRPATNPAIWLERRQLGAALLEVDGAVVPGRDGGDVRQAVAPLRGVPPEVAEGRRGRVLRREQEVEHVPGDVLVAGVRRARPAAAASSASRSVSCIQ